MAKFVKRPVVIEAIRLSYDRSTRHDALAWLREHGKLTNYTVDDDGVLIQTLEGAMRASPGDWIIRGVKGELYPCKPDIFASTYEFADDGEQL